MKKRFNLARKTEYRSWAAKLKKSRKRKIRRTEKGEKKSGERERGENRSGKMEERRKKGEGRKE